MGKEMARPSKVKLHGGWQKVIPRPGVSVTDLVRKHL